MKRLVGYITLMTWNNRVARVLTSPSYIRWEVMQMKLFDFKDLMAFGMFILALLTLIIRLIG